MRRTALLGFLLALVVVASDSRGARASHSTSGSWLTTGTITEPPEFAGTSESCSVQVVESGSALSGFLQCGVVLGACLGGGSIPFSGSTSGGTISFGSGPVAWTGTRSGDSASGTWSGTCFGQTASGTWSGVKTSNPVVTVQPVESRDYLADGSDLAVLEARVFVPSGASELAVPAEPVAVGSAPAGVSVTPGVDATDSQGIARFLLTASAPANVALSFCSPDMCDTGSVNFVEVPLCGNGLLDLGEECDDGNRGSGDGCDADCLVEFCGDGRANNVDEQCDDGNLADGDGCSSACTTEEVCGGPMTRVRVLNAGCPSTGYITSCPGEVRDVDGVNGPDCLVGSVRDDLGRSLELWCGNFGSNAGEFNLFLNGNPAHQVGKCSYPAGQNTWWLNVKGPKPGQPGSYECLVSSSWRNEDVIDREEDGYQDDYYHYFFFDPVSTERKREDRYTRNSPAVLVSSRYVDLAVPLAPGSSSVLQGDPAMTMNAAAVCDLDGDGGCDTQDEVVFLAALGSCIGDPSFEPLADADADGCVTEADRQLLGLASPVSATRPLGVGILCALLLAVGFRATASSDRTTGART